MVQTSTISQIAEKKIVESVIEFMCTVVILQSLKQVSVFEYGVVFCRGLILHYQLTADTRSNRTGKVWSHGQFLCESTINSFFHKTFSSHSWRTEQRKMCVSVYSSVATNTIWMKDNYDNCKLSTKMPPERMLASLCWSEKVGLIETTIKSRFAIHPFVLFTLILGRNVFMNNSVWFYRFI